LRNWRSWKYDRRNTPSSAFAESTPLKEGNVTKINEHYNSPLGKNKQDLNRNEQSECDSRIVAECADLWLIATHNGYKAIKKFPSFRGVRL